MLGAGWVYHQISPLQVERQIVNIIGSPDMDRLVRQPNTTSILINILDATFSLKCDFFAFLN